MVGKSAVAAILVFGLGSGLPAQAKTDFSGVWAPVPAKASAPGQTSGVAALPPSDLTIEQSATAVAMSRTAFDIITTQTYKLDGSESTNRSGAVTRVTHCRWDGPRLIIEGKASQVTSAGYAAWTLKETYAISARGHLVLTSEHVATDGAVTTGTLEYTKKSSK